MNAKRLPIAWLCAPLAITSLLVAISARGAAFDLPDQDAFVIGRGMAFVATADNPSAIYYNPAGITQLTGSNLRVGLYSIYLDPSYRPPPPATGTFDNQDPLHAIPQFYYTYSREDWPVSLGLGVYSPFGLSVRWPQNTGFRTVATQGALTTDAINPVVALKLSRRFSIGGGLVINYANADLRQGLFSPDQATDSFRFAGDGWDVGYNLGALWQFNDQVSLGATFRSGMNVELRGHTTAVNRAGPAPIFDARTVANAEFPLPLKAILGISYRPTPQWNLEFNADYTDWTQLGTVTIHQAAPLLGTPTIPLVLDLQSSWYYEFGATRYFTNGWLASAGYIFSQNSAPDAHYSPLLADLDRHFLSVGTGFRGKRFDFDVAYQFGYGPTRTVTGSAPSAAGQTADGNYEFFSHAIAVSVGAHF